VSWKTIIIDVVEDLWRNSGVVGVAEHIVSFVEKCYRVSRKKIENSLIDKVGLFVCGSEYDPVREISCVEEEMIIRAWERR
jgi:hypothetical protein